MSTVEECEEERDEEERERALDEREKGRGF